MKELFTKKVWVIPLILALLISSASVVGAMEKNTAEKNVPAADGEAVSAPGHNASRLYEEMRDTLLSRRRWLYDLMMITGKAQPDESSDVQTVFDVAQSCGILTRYTEQEMYAPLDRLFAAQTTVRALGYKNRSIGYLADITSVQSDMATMAYYGYFLPDINFMVHPEARITVQEYENLIRELNRFQLLKGKTVLSFGDSIMHGSGNSGEGICDIIAEKYGMTAADYSIPGAAMGYRSGRGHIRDQLQLALDDKIEPDIILLNGGTNDMNLVEFGKLTEGFDMSKTSEASFTGGFEKTMWSLRKNWKDVPVVYIRVHDMDIGEDANERKYGERALELADKWGAATVDLYTETDMNTADAATSNRYTCFDPENGHLSDNIHPNALGYAKFYLPLISETVVNQIQSEE